MVRYLFCAGGNNSVVECDLAKVEVAGSNPVSRSNLRSRLPSARELRLAGHREGCPPELAQRAKADQIDDADIRPHEVLFLDRRSGHPEPCRGMLPLVSKRGRIISRTRVPAGAVAKW